MRSIIIAIVLPTLPLVEANGQSLQKPALWQNPMRPFPHSPSISAGRIIRYDAAHSNTIVPALRRPGIPESSKVRAVPPTDSQNTGRRQVMATGAKLAAALMATQHLNAPAQAEDAATPAPTKPPPPPDCKATRTCTQPPNMNKIETNGAFYIPPTEPPGPVEIVKAALKPIPAGWKAVIGCVGFGGLTLIPYFGLLAGKRGGQELSEVQSSDFGDVISLAVFAVLALIAFALVRRSRRTIASGKEPLIDLRNE